MTDEPDKRLDALARRLDRLGYEMSLENERLRSELRLLRDRPDDVRPPPSAQWPEFLAWLSVAFLTFFAAIWALGIPEYTRALSDRIRVETELTRIAVAAEAPGPIVALVAPAEPPAEPSAEDAGEPGPEGSSGIGSRIWDMLINGILPILVGLALAAGGVYLAILLLRDLFNRYGAHVFRSRAEGLRMLTASGSLVSMSFAGIRYWRNIDDNLAIEYVFFSGLAALGFALVFAATGSVYWGLGIYLFVMGALFFVSFISKGSALAFWDEYMRLLADSTGPEGTLLFLGMTAPILLVAITCAVSVLRPSPPAAP